MSAKRGREGSLCRLVVFYWAVLLAIYTSEKVLAIRSTEKGIGRSRKKIGRKRCHATNSGAAEQLSLLLIGWRLFKLHHA